MRRQLCRSIEAPPPVEALLPRDAADVVKRASRGPSLGDRYLGDFVDASRPKLGRSSVDLDNLALRRPIRPAGRHDPTANRGSIVESCVQRERVRYDLPDSAANVNVYAHAGTTPSSFSSRVRASSICRVSPVVLIVICTLLLLPPRMVMPSVIISTSR